MNCHKSQKIVIEIVAKIVQFNRCNTWSRTESQECNLSYERTNSVKTQEF